MGCRICFPDQTRTTTVSVCGESCGFGLAKVDHGASGPKKKMAEKWILRRMVETGLTGTGGGGGGGDQNWINPFWEQQALPACSAAQAVSAGLEIHSCLLSTR